MNIEENKQEPEQEAEILYNLRNRPIRSELRKRKRNEVKKEEEIDIEISMTEVSVISNFEK